MKKVFCVAIAIVCNCVAFFSCSQEENVAGEKEILSAEVNINGISVAKKDGMLVFESEAQMKEALNKAMWLRPEVLSTRNGDVAGKLPTNELIRGFKSLYDLFSDAIDEAEDYYERPGGYEEFKQKYPIFYFPEVGDDYSAYLPVSDKNLAKLADVNGNVMVENNVISLIDVTSYEQLKALGQTPPEDTPIIQTRATSGTNSIAEEKTSENKVWVNTDIKKNYNAPYDPTPALFVEVCFRKKGILGVWYNHRSTTRITNFPPGSVPGLYVYGNMPVAQEGFSSHDYYYLITTTGVPNSGIVYSVALNGNITIFHQGTNKNLTLTISRPSIRVM
jgi:hypothetical protein